MPKHPPERNEPNSGEGKGAVDERKRRRFVVILFLIALAMLGIVVAPFVGAFFTAALLGAILYPWQVVLTRRLGGRNALAAALLTIATILVVVIPIGGISVVVIAKGVDAVEWVSQKLQSDGVDGLIEPLPEGVQEPARRAIALLPSSLLDALGILRRNANGNPPVSRGSHKGNHRPKVPVTSRARA